VLATTGIAKAYGGRTLFENVTLQLNAGARYGLVGANGSGKSTFLRILCGDEEATSGSLRINKGARLGVLRQDRFLDDAEIILDLAMRGDVLVSSALAEQRQLAEDPHPDAHRLSDLEDLVAAHDGYTLEARASAVLEGLGIPLAQQRSALSTLSGGFKLRVLLAQVLIGGADLLLLDEPTNHLDILSIRWLEKFLGGYDGCAVIISHDQRFLDNVTTATLDVDYQTITLYPHSYSAFVTEKEAIRARKETVNERALDEIARKRAFVDRFGAKATKATQAQSRLRQIEKIEVEELAPTSRRTPMLRFEPARPSGKEVLELAALSKAYGPKRVLSNVSLVIRRGERVAIIGPNGLGKSTLLRIAVDHLAADTGTVRWGHEVRLGYFPQDHRETLDDPQNTPLETVWAAYPGETLTVVRTALGRVLFSGDDVNKKIGTLSGGEAARLIFALLVAARPNVLVLDEPTNHLDIEAINALVAALKAYQGTVIFVSHDRWFVSELATRVVELTPQGPRDFPGSYAEFIERCGDDHLDADTVVLKARRERERQGAAAGGGAAEPRNKGSWEEQKKRRNRLIKLPQERDRVLEKIARAEARQKEIEALYCSPGFFERSSATEVEALEREKEGLGPRIEKLMAEWEALEAELVSLKVDGDADAGA
jgi:ATPase subunit of ABC transporter with duplicated ATPase domains